MIALGIGISLLVSGAIGSYIYVNNLKSDLKSLREDNIANQLKIETQDKTIKELLSDIDKQTDALNTIIKRNRQIQKEVDRYLEIFKKHDFARLSAAKPGLIEKRVNKATADVFDQIETDSTFNNDSVSE